MSNIKEKTVKEIIATDALVHPVFCFQCKHFLQTEKHEAFKIGKCRLYDCIKKEIGYCDKGEIKEE